MEATALAIYAAAWGPTVRGTPKIPIVFRTFCQTLCTKNS